MEYLFNCLNRYGFNQTNIEKTIFSMDKLKLSELIEELTNIPSEERITYTDDFVFTTNSDLGGGRDYCCYIECRKSRIYELSKFAIMFADTVIIDNPFDWYYLFDEFNERDIFDLIEDIKLLFYMRPLLDEKIFSFLPNKNHFCRNCFEEIIKQDLDYYKNLKRMHKKALNVYQKSSKVKIVIENGISFFEIQGPVELIPHGSYWTEISTKNIKEIAKRIPIKNNYELKPKEAKELKVIDKVVDMIYDDLLNRKWRKMELGVKYVTNKDIELNILKTLDSRDTLLRNDAMMKGLSHVVPYIDNVNLEDIIQFRKDEQESFIVYRDRINRIVKNIKSQDSSIYREAFNDEIKKHANLNGSLLTTNLN